MTVLRSREIGPRMKLPSPAKTKDTFGVLEPGTPAKILEGLNRQSTSSPLSVSPKASAQGAVGLGSGNVVRRSLRLASKLGSDLIKGVAGVESVSRKRKRSDADANLGCGLNLGTSVTGKAGVAGKGDLQVGGGNDKVSDKMNSELGALRESIKEMVDVTRVKPKESGLLADSGNLNGGNGGVQSRINRNRKRISGVDVELSGLVLSGQEQGQNEEKILHLRSGKKIIKNEVNNSAVNGSQRVESNGGEKFFCSDEVGGVADGCCENGIVMAGSKANAEVVGNDNINTGNELTRKEKAKGKVVEKDSFTSSIDIVKLKPDIEEADRNTSGRTMHVETRSLGRKEKRKVVGKDSFTGSIDMVKSKPDIKEGDRNTSGRTMHAETRRLGKKEKGKEKLVEHGFTSNSQDAVKHRSVNDVGKGSEIRASGDSSFVEASPGQNAGQINMSMTARERFRDIARRNASRFAHFSAEDNEDNHITDIPCEIPPSDGNGEEEDWPGPFSTAMKIIKDRQKLSLQQQNTFVDKKGVTPIKWMPRKDRNSDFPRQSVPLLQDICTTVLVKHADAITSLDCIPDVLRHKLCQLLSDSRRMNSHFLGLLLQGSPTEIRIRDCSWLSEDMFTRAFEGCDTSNLTVLQLDLCGRSLADYILLDTLACSPNSLPALTRVSFRAAYRLSDVGLSALVSSAPSLRSVDLSQCSLLTSDGICCLAASLGSVLRELYLDDCQGIDAMLILPALLNLQNLEVLSLSRLETVCDDFIYKFLCSRGHRMKELVLADCKKLTDSSVRVIAETCPELCAVDLSNLCKLTDSAIGYLASGCRAIQTVKMHRNSFSDEAVAAYLETCGDSLTELSLSNVGQVGQNTAISLSRHSKNLNYLDVSWCRNLTDAALGLIVDSCSSLKVLKLFGCTQITDVFLLGHSNQEVQIIGLKMKPLLENLKEPDMSHGPLRYSSVSF